MPLASFGRRRWLQVASAWAGAFGLRRAWAQSGLVAPIKDLCDALLRIMKAGSATPFAQRFAMLAGDRPECSIFQRSSGTVGPPGPRWTRTARRAVRRAPPLHDRQLRQRLQHFTGQQLNVVPEGWSLPNGEQLVPTR